MRAEGAYLRVAESGRHSGEEHRHSWQDGSANEVTTVVHTLHENFDELRPFLICEKHLPMREDFLNYSEDITLVPR